MTVVATFELPAGESPLGRVLTAADGVRVDFETSVPTNNGTVPFLWVTAGDTDAVESALDSDPTTGSAECVVRTDERALFRVDWETDVGGILGLFEEYDAVVLEAWGERNQWTFRTRFADNDELSTFYQSCLEADLEIELVRTQESNGDVPVRGYGLTQEQRLTLTTAARNGYFEVPRRCSLGTIAEELGISDSAASQRLRRGLSGLLSATLLDSPDRDQE
jgi:predicted DNA binding protein